MKIPEGWKLVPIEPTAEMLCEAELAYNGSHRDAYREMLAAAPTPPAQDDEWQQAVLNECMAIEGCYKESDPAGTVKCLIDWHVKNERDHTQAQDDEPVLYTRPDGLRKAAEALIWAYDNHEHCITEIGDLRAALEGK